MAGSDLEFEDEDFGERVDVVLVRRVAGLSRDRAKVLFSQGLVRVNGARVKKSHRLRAGDRITVAALPEAVDFDAEPDESTAIRVVEETRDFVIVDKPVGVPSHPLVADEVGTVANALVARYPEMRGVGYRRREPGIIHRLDNDTSGLILAARHIDAFDELASLLRQGKIDKHYRATCVGLVQAPQMIRTPIASDPHNHKRVRACLDAREAKRLGAQPAVTEVLRSTPDAAGSIVDARATNARRHQVRVHLASIGHPLLGDALYGAPIHPTGHHHLVASRIAFEWDARTVDVNI
ncbi:MAG: RluA family pseudouridine synthase [Myxococcota bacterium]